MRLETIVLPLFAHIGSGLDRVQIQSIEMEVGHSDLFDVPFTVGMFILNLSEDTSTIWDSDRVTVIVSNVRDYLNDSLELPNAQSVTFHSISSGVSSIVFKYDSIAFGKKLVGYHRAWKNSYKGS